VTVEQVIAATEATLIVPDDVRVMPVVDDTQAIAATGL